MLSPPYITHREIPIFRQAPTTSTLSHSGSLSSSLSSPSAGVSRSRSEWARWRMAMYLRVLRKCYLSTPPFTLQPTASHLSSTEKTHLDDHIRSLNTLHQPLPAPRPPPPRPSRKPIMRRRRYRIDIAHNELYQRVDVFRRDGLDPLFKVVNVPVEGVDVELDRGEFVDA